VSHVFVVSFSRQERPLEISRTSKVPRVAVLPAKVMANFRRFFQFLSGSAFPLMRRFVLEERAISHRHRCSAKDVRAKCCPRFRLGVSARTFLCEVITAQTIPQHIYFFDLLLDDLKLFALSQPAPSFLRSIVELPRGGLVLASYCFVRSFPYAERALSHAAKRVWAPWSDICQFMSPSLVPVPLVVPSSSSKRRPRYGPYLTEFPC